MARARAVKASGGASQSRSIKGGPKLTGMLMDHGVVGTGIKGGASTARPIPPMAKPTSRNTKGHIGGTLRRGKRGG